MIQPRLSDRTFGLVFASIFAIFSGIGWFFFNEILRWAFIASGLFGLFALVLPGALLPLNRLWGVLTGRIHRVVNFLLLASFFYLLVLPFGLVMRLVGRDAMQLKTDRQAKTYWTPVTRHTDEDTLPDMF